MSNYTDFFPQGGSSVSAAPILNMYNGFGIVADTAPITVPLGFTPTDYRTCFVEIMGDTRSGPVGTFFAGLNHYKSFGVNTSSISLFAYWSNGTTLILDSSSSTSVVYYIRVTEYDMSVKNTYINTVGGSLGWTVGNIRNVYGHYYKTTKSTISRPLQGFAQGYGVSNPFAGFQAIEDGEIYLSDDQNIVVGAGSAGETFAVTEFQLN